MKRCVFVLSVFLSAAAMASASIDYTPIEFEDDVENLRLCFKVAREPVQTEEKTVYSARSYAEYTNVLERVSRLKKLKELEFAPVFEDGGSNTFDCACLSGLTTLTNLTLAGGLHLTSLKGLEKLPLTNLDLYVHVNDFSALAELKSLKSFTAPSGFRQGDLSFIPAGIQELEIHDGSFGDEVDLSGFKDLRYLLIGENPGVDKPATLKGFEALGKLEELQLHGDYGYCVDCLSACTNLRSLGIETSCRGDIPIKWLPDLSCLGGLPLKIISISNSKIRKVRGLEKCPLEWLYLRNSHLRSLDDICDLPKLKWLDVEDSGIDSADREELKKRFPALEVLLYINEEGEQDSIEPRKTTEEMKAAEGDEAEDRDAEAGSEAQPASWESLKIGDAKEIESRFAKPVPPHLSPSGSPVKKFDVMKRMKEIKLPSVSFRPPANLMDVVRYLEKVSVPLDGSGEVILFAVQPTGPDEIYPVVSEVKAEDITFYDFLRLMMDCEGARFDVREDGVVVVSPRDWTCDDGCAPGEEYLLMKGSWPEKDDTAKPREKVDAPAKSEP